MYKNNFFTNQMYKKKNGVCVCTVPPPFVLPQRGGNTRVSFPRWGKEKDRGQMYFVFALAIEVEILWLADSSTPLRMTQVKD